MAAGATRGAPHGGFRAQRLMADGAEGAVRLAADPFGEGDLVSASNRAAALSPETQRLCPGLTITGTPLCS